MRKKISQVQPQQLSHFGLDPDQWIISEETTFAAEFIHIDDPEFRCLAYLEPTSDPKEISQLEWVI